MECDSGESIERAHAKAIYSESYTLEERNYYMSIMKDHTQSVKVLCNLLGEAQTAILDIAKKLKASNQTEVSQTVCTNKSEKSMQLGSTKELSNNQQTSNHELELKSFSEKDEYCCSPDISTQVEREDCISDKETLSDVTTSVAHDDDVIIDKVNEIGAVLREKELGESNSSLYDGYLHEETGFSDYFVEREFNNLSVISERTEKSTSEADSICSTANNDLVKPTASQGFSYIPNRSSKPTKIVESAQSSKSEKESFHSTGNRDQPEPKPWKTFTSSSSSNGAKESQSLRFVIPEEENVIINEQQAKILNVFCEELNCPMNINKDFTKTVKPLKCRAAEVVISSIISQTNSKGIDEIKSSKSSGESIQGNKDIQNVSKTLEVSARNKLAIQMMPSIDIRRGLVTQMIPAIVINPSESIPPKDVLQDSNVAYEIVRHISSDKINYPVAVRESSPGGTATSCIAEKCKVRYALQSMKSNTGSVEHEILCNTDVPETEFYHWKNLHNGCDQFSAKTLESEHSSSPTYTNLVFGKAIAKKRADDGRASIQASLRLDVPVTTFMNNCFKAESESEIFIMNKDLEAEIASAESNTTRTELLGKNCVKEFVNKMMKNPKTEAVFKSYQVIQEQLGHDPEEVEVSSHLSYMDTDVYKTFVNPEGLKGHRDNSHNIFDKYSTLGVTTPLEFYATKSVQCGEATFKKTAQDNIVEDKVTKCKEIEENVPEDKVVEDKMITEIKTVNPDQDNTSQTTNIWSIDSVSQDSSLSKDGEGLKFYKTEPTPSLTGIREIVQDPSYISRATKMLHPLNSPRASIVNSRNSIPRDVRKQLAKSSNVNRGSNQRSSLNRRSPQPGRILELLSSKPKQGSEHSHMLKNSHSVPSPASSKESQFGGSLKSESTADVIFQINRESLRSKSVQSKIDLDQLSAESLKRRSASGSKVESMGSRGMELQSAPTTSEYVITHDVSLQTSLTDLSEAVINLHRYSKDSVATGVEKLKQIVGEDTQSESDLNTFVCCPGLRCNKNKTSNDVYMKSIKQVQPMQTIPGPSLLYHTDNEQQKNVKMDLPEASTVYKPQTPGVILPDSAHEHAGNTPVGSFIEGLTSHNKNEIFLAKNTPPKNDLSVLEDLDAAEIVNAIKRATESWKEFDKQRDMDSGTAEVSSQTSAQNIRLTNDDFVHGENKIDCKTKKNERKSTDGSENNSDDVNMSTVEAFTIMTVNVEHPELIGNRQLQMQAKESEKPLPNTFPLHRNVPGGDDFSEPLELGNSDQFYVTHARHDGIFPRHTSRRQKQFKKMYESSSSSEATTCESSLEKTDENLSEGEVKCKCSASIGEVHVCPFGKSRKSIQYLKRNAQNFLKHEFGSRDVKIRWKKEYNSNWVAYYVSRNASPELDNSESVDKSSTDSSGLIRK